jgi:hypothetical protein
MTLFAVKQQKTLITASSESCCVKALRKTGCNSWQDVNRSAHIYKTGVVMPPFQIVLLFDLMALTSLINRIKVSQSPDWPLPF